jgi:uncharacterized protein Yka (UPF0111/DUF47 family)
MLSLKKLLGKDDKFFDLLEAGAQEAKTSAELFAGALRKIATGTAAGVSLDEFIQSRRKEKRIRHLMTEELSKTFVTPLEREDIEELSFALYRIPKQVEKIVERLSIYPGRIPHAAFERQAELMLQAADAVVFMVGQLRGGTNVERIREANDRLQFPATRVNSSCSTTSTRWWSRPSTAAATPATSSSRSCSSTPEPAPPPSSGPDPRDRP